MKTYGYYSFTDEILSGARSIDSCSICSDERPLMVNCAGSFNTEFPFTTNNPSGRLDFYFMCIVSGELTLTAGGHTQAVTAGNVIVIPPNTPYRYTNASSGHLSYLWVHFTGSRAKETIVAYDLKPFPHISLTSDLNAITLRFKAIFEAYAHKNALRDEELSSLLDLLLISAARSCAAGDSPCNELVRSVRRINSYYNTDLKIPDLAKEEHLSVSRYNVLFKKQFGVSPTKYILKLRMDSACDLLSSTDLSIKQIGLLSGYNDPHFFSKTFRSFIGISPSEFRERANNG